MNVCCSPFFLSFPTDVIIVGYEFMVYTTFERQGMVELSIVIFYPPSGGAPRPFTFSISTGAGTAGTCKCTVYCTMTSIFDAHA